MSLQVKRLAYFTSIMSEADYNSITKRIISCAIEVHRNPGPGLMESVYDICLYKEMCTEGLTVKRQVLTPVIYKNQQLDKDFIMDQLVEDVIVLKLKSVEIILPIHEAQLVTYLKLSGKRLGLLINFNVPKLTEGIRRKINGDLNN